MARPKRRKKRSRPRPKANFTTFVEGILGKQPRRKRRERLRRRLDKRFAGGVEGRQSWDRVASQFGRFMPIEIKEKEARAIAKFGGINRTDRIASLGSGIAILEAFFARQLVPKGEVVCVDFSHEMSKMAIQTKRKAQVENLRIVTASGIRTPLPASSQDKVIISYMLTPPRNWVPLLREARRIIKKTPEARLIISFAVTPKEWWVVDAVAASLLATGFAFMQPKSYYKGEGKDALLFISKPAEN